MAMKKKVKTDSPSSNSVPELSSDEMTLAAVGSGKEDGPQHPKDVKAHLAKEIYDLIVDGPGYPGYTLVPEAKAAGNPTVDTVLAVIAGQAVCKLKKGVDKPVAPLRHNRGRVTDKGERDAMNALSSSLGLR